MSGCLSESDCENRMLQCVGCAGLRRSVLGERCPAITIVIVGIYDEAWLLEIEAVAGA